MPVVFWEQQPYSCQPLIARHPRGGGRGRDRNRAPLRASEKAITCNLSVASWFTNSTSHCTCYSLRWGKVCTVQMQRSPAHHCL